MLESIFQSIIQQNYTFEVNVYEILIKFILNYSFSIFYIFLRCCDVVKFYLNILKLKYLLELYRVLTSPQPANSCSHISSIPS